MHGNLLSIIVPVYRDADRAIALARQLTQLDTKGHGLEVVVVDDGSGDGSGERLRDTLGAGARVVLLSRNIGRARARNEGARHARGGYLLFLDADCLPEGPELFSKHLASWSDAAVASTGPVTGNGRGFWNDYQAAAAERRARQYAEGIFYAGSGTNLLVRRDVFEACGGFDAGYEGYGFEDRDLLLRLLRLGSIAWATDAWVRHMDDLDLAGVCRKLHEAGGAPSARFAAGHPEAYLRLGYARVDARYRPWLRPLAGISRPLVPLLARLADPTLHWRWVPFRVRSSLAKGLGALAFLAGSSAPAASALH